MNIETFDEFKRRMDCDYFYVKNRYLFRNGGQSDQHFHTDPPTDATSRLVLEREFLQDKLERITKQFTATMIMQLVKEGKLQVDDPFETILPEMPKAWAKVTVKNLLNHTSGVKSYTEIPGLFAGDAMKPTTPMGIMKKVENAPLDFEPGHEPLQAGSTRSSAQRSSESDQNSH